MRANLAVAIALLPVVLATPQPPVYHHGEHGHGHGYGRHGHGIYKSGQLSGRPFPTAAGTAPHGLGNSTVGLGSTGRVTVATTPIPPIPTPNGNNLETTQAPLSAETPVESASVIKPTFAANPDKPDTCDSGTATVTYNPTVTVTVTPGVQSHQEPSSTEAAEQHVKTLTVLPVAQKPSETPTPKEPASKSPKAPVSKAPKTPASKVPKAPVSKAPKSPQSKASENAETKPSQDTLVPVPKPAEAPVPTQAPTSAAVKATSTPPKVAPSTAPSVPSTNSGNKRGLLASGHDMNQLVSAFDNSSKITWLGDWYSLPPPNLGSHIEFVPQNYGKQSDIAPHFEWTSNAKKSVAEGLKYFLSFGEPETPNDLLHMDPQEAVDLFMKEMQPYAGSVTIGAPPVTQPDSDLAWLSQFLELCDAAGCSIGFVCVHWFWSATEDHIQDFKDTVTKAIGIAKGKPVWVDNFQATGTNADQQNFLNGVLPWLESNPSVARYAYVSPERSTGTGLLNPDGSMSSLGEFYANF